MKLYKRILKEKRSHPDLNPIITPYDKLKKYKDDSDIYISFTLFNKIGINPGSNYKTPNGIYCYPLKEIWKVFDHKNKEVNSRLFGFDRRYIQVLKGKGGSKFIEDINKTYTLSNYNDDIDKIFELYKDNMSTKRIWEVISEARKNTRSKTIGGYFWNITRYMANNGENPRSSVSSGFTNKWNKLFRDLGYQGVADKTGHAVIHPSEPISAVFFTRNSFELIKTIDRAAGADDHMTPEGPKVKGQLRPSGAGKIDAEYDTYQKVMFQNNLLKYTELTPDNEYGPVLKLNRNGSLKLDYSKKKNSTIYYIPKIKSKAFINPSVPDLFAVINSWHSYVMLRRMLVRNEWIFYQIIKKLDKLIDQYPGEMKNLVKSITDNEEKVKDSIKIRAPILYKYMEKHLFNHEFYKNNQ